MELMIIYVLKKRKKNFTKPNINKNIHHKTKNNVYIRNYELVEHELVWKGKNDENRSKYRKIF